MEWCVVTDTGERDGKPSEGNLAAALVYEPDGGVSRNSALAMIGLRQPVWCQGEITVVHEGGREVLGKQRHCGKWEITCHTFRLTSMRQRSNSR